MQPTICFHWKSKFLLHNLLIINSNNCVFVNCDMLDRQKCMLIIYCYRTKGHQHKQSILLQYKPEQIIYKFQCWWWGTQVKWLFIWYCELLPYSEDIIIIIIITSHSLTELLTIFVELESETGPKEGMLSVSSIIVINCIRMKILYVNSLIIHAYVHEFYQRIYTRRFAGSWINWNLK
jgi:hypothetical protein